MIRRPAIHRGWGGALRLAALGVIVGWAMPCLEAGGPGEDAERGPPLTALAAGPLGRSTHVVLGEVLERQGEREISIVRVRVERWLRGHADEPEIHVLVGGPAPTADARRPSAPYFSGKAGASYLLFLARRERGTAFALENRIEVAGLEAQEKVAAVEAQIGLAAIAEPEERARRVLAHFLTALTAPGAWTRANAARELNYLATVRPQAFAPVARLRLQRVADGPATAPAVRTWLRNLLTVLGPEGDDAAAGRTEPPAPQPEDRAPELGPAAGAALPVADRIGALDAALARSGADAPRRALVLYREIAQPPIRAWLVDWLAESGHAAALPLLRLAYATEDEPVVREALVRATGLLGSEADVPWLVERLQNARLVEHALLALARVRSPAALEALRAFRARCVAGDDEQRDLAGRIDLLLSPAFEEGERLGGHRLGPERAAESAPGR